MITYEYIWGLCMLILILLHALRTVHVLISSQFLFLSSKLKLQITWNLSHCWIVLVYLTFNSGDSLHAHVVEMLKWMYCCFLPLFQLGYLYKVNSCFSTTGLLYSNIRSVWGAGDAGNRSQLWKLLSVLGFQERSRKNLFIFFLIPGFFFFFYSLSETYFNISFEKLA